MALSLVTTTRERPNLLLECALSVSKQGKQPDEWIIYVDDDMSKYAEVLAKVRLLVPQVRVLHEGIVGRVHALAVAHDAVTTEYCGLLDDDDWLDHDCLSECANYDSDIIYTDFYCVKDGVATVGRRNRCPYALPRMLKVNIMFHFRLYRTALYRAVGGVDLSYDTAMDYEVTLRMLLENPTITKINKPLYYYRVHDQSITGRSRERQQENFRRAVATAKYRLVTDRHKVSS